LEELGRQFDEPTCSAHRQYEALRAFYLDGLSSAEAAKKFGYTVGSFRVLCHSFRKHPGGARKFFVDSIAGAVAEEEEQEPENVTLIVELRKQNLSIYDISATLKPRGIKLSPAAISKILREQGFTKLPRRARDNRFNAVETGTIPAEQADVRRFDFEGKSFTTKFGGLFLLVPYLVDSRLSELAREHLPGTETVPAEHALRSLLALKLFGTARAGHVMSYVFDQGLALFSGLNCIPKRSFLGEYSRRVDPDAAKQLIEQWFRDARNLGLELGTSFDVDFHTIPFHGDDPLVGKHYISKRSRKQKGNLAFLVWDAENTHFCFANGAIPKGGQADEIIKFADYWKGREGGDNAYPDELIFDSTLTTYSNLAKLDQRGIKFITLRRRSKKLIDELWQRGKSEWRKIAVDNVSRQFRYPHIIDENINLPHYGTIRQIAIKGLGHEQPTLLITNHKRTSAGQLIGRYARRMIIENGIADSIDFFHMDSLSSSVALRVDHDLMLTLIAGSIYRIFAGEIGGAYVTAKFAHIFRDFIDAVADVKVTSTEVEVRYQRRSHNPLLIKSGLLCKDTIVPWWGGKRLILKLK